MVAAAAGCPEPQTSDLGSDQSQVDGDWHERRLVLVDQALVLDRNILGARHKAIATTCDLREHVLDRRLASDDEEAASSVNGGGAVSENGRTVLILTDKARTVGFSNETEREYEEAERWYRQALEAGRTEFGEEHPDTIESMRSLASLYERLGRYAEAESLAERVFEFRTWNLGVNHSDTLRSKHDLKGIFEHQGRVGQAERLYVEAFEESRRLFGDKDVNTLHRMRDLA